MAVLTSTDGKFSCKAEHAVEMAYLLSTAEGCIMEAPLDAVEIADLIRGYLQGEMTAEEAMQAMRSTEGE